MNTVNKLEKLEALRGAAAVYVVCHHTIPRDIEWLGLKPGVLLSFGQEAVITFFLLSGFVIAYAFARSSNRSFGRYFSSRFCRIYIPLFAVFLITWVFESLRTGSPVNPDIVNLLGNAFMLQDLGSEYPGTLFMPYLGNGPLWSLSYEWWFYLLFFPLVTQIGNRHIHYIAYGIACIAAVAYILFPVFPLRVLMHFAIWWTGAYLAYLYLNRNHFKFLALLLPIIVLTFITTLQAINIWWYFEAHGQLPGFLPHPVSEFRHFAFALFIVLTGLVWLRLGAPLYNWLLKPFVFFAPISYGIYICHDPVMRDATYLDFIGHPVVEWILYFLIVLTVATLIESVLYTKLKLKMQPAIETVLNRWKPASLLRSTRAQLGLIASGWKGRY